jgi:hypothetical protein
VSQMPDQPIPPDSKIPAVKDPGSSNAPPIIFDPTAIADGNSSPLRKVISVFLSFCLGVFLIAGIVSLVDDSLALLFGLHTFLPASGIFTAISILLLIVLYGLIGITPLIPKRVFLPIIIYNLLGFLSSFPILIYHREWSLQFDWLLSLGHVLVCLGIFLRLRNEFKFRWRIIEARHLGDRAFSWLNSSVFLAANLFVLIPAVAAYLTLCASLAIGHFTGGFVALRPGGIILRAHKYVRADGKSVLLFPTSHIADATFYNAVAQSVSSNTVVLLEGVTDEQNLLTNHLSYEHAAKSLGLAEQKDTLDIQRGELVLADVDVADFSPSTIEILNRIALIYSKGFDVATVLQLLQYAPPPGADQLLWTDLLEKRNEHLLKEFNERLPNAESFVIPWGAAHMPGISKAIQASGFHLVETHEYVSIRFGRRKHQPAVANENHQPPK